MMSVMVFVAIAFSDHRVTNRLFPGHANDMDDVMESFPLMVGIICSSLFLVFPNGKIFHFTAATAGRSLLILYSWYGRCVDRGHPTACYIQSGPRPCMATSSSSAPPSASCSPPRKSLPRYILERPCNPQFNGPWKNQISTALWY